MLSGHVGVWSSRTDEIISLPSLKGPRLHLETWSAPWSSPHSSWSGPLRLTRVAGPTWPTAWPAGAVWHGSASRVGRASASSPSRLAWRSGRWRWSISSQIPTTPSPWRLWTACRSCCPTRGSTPRSTCRPTCLVSWRCRNTLRAACGNVESRQRSTISRRSELTSSNNAVLTSPLCSLGHFQNRTFFDVSLEKPFRIFSVKGCVVVVFHNLNRRQSIQRNYVKFKRN